MSELTIFLLYLVAALLFGASCYPRHENRRAALNAIATLLTVAGVVIHTQHLFAATITAQGFDLSVGNTISMIGLELAVIALLASFDSALKGTAAGLLLLGALAAAATLADGEAAAATPLIWQIKAHVLISLLSYGLITVGAIVAVYALVQERRLQKGELLSSSYLFAPLETTESLLFGITAAGFTGLLLAILSGLTFVDSLFAQHLAHKTVFSILALLVFGILLAGRFIAGWRGARAVNLYLGGFLLLCVAYFGTRLILEQLDRSWT